MNDNTEKFSGKAGIYSKYRPSYSDKFIDYLYDEVGFSKAGAIADVGAGTGKFTKLLLERSLKVICVEPNPDMRGQLEITLSQYSNVVIVSASAEETTLPDNSVDIITCAQALHWFDPNAFWNECRRIGKPDSIVIAIYNNTPGGSSIAHSKLSTDVFFTNPTIKEFPNPIFYTREKWLTYMTSHSHDPLPSDPNYAEHIAEMNAVFDRENVNGLLQRDVITKIYNERVNP